MAHPSRTRRPRPGRPPTSTPHQRMQERLHIQRRVHPPLAGAMPPLQRKGLATQRPLGRRDHRPSDPGKDQRRARASRARKSEPQTVKNAPGQAYVFTKTLIIPHPEPAHTCLTRQALKTQRTLLRLSPAGTQYRAARTAYRVPFACLTKSPEQHGPSSRSKLQAPPAP